MCLVRIAARGCISLQMWSVSVVVFPEDPVLIMSHEPRLNQEILVPEWLITSHMTEIAGSDRLFNWSGMLLVLPLICRWNHVEGSLL